MSSMVINPMKPMKMEEPWKSKLINNQTFYYYYYQLLEIATNRFKWINLPDSIDERFLEITLCQQGFILYFNDEALGNITLPCTVGGRLNIYRVPIERRAYSVSGYYRELNEHNSVIIYNNYLRQPTIYNLIMYARKLYEVDRAIDINIKAQKTPVLIVTDDDKVFSLKQVYKKYDGNEPAIFATFQSGIENMKVLKTDAPYLADKLQLAKKQIWSDALTYLGVENNNTEKKERVISNEVISNLGAVESQRYNVLNSRKQACNQINKMFGVDLDVEFNQEIYTFSSESVGEDYGNLYDRT